MKNTALELVPTGTQVANFDDSQLEDLAKPLNEALIKERQGPGGKMLKYITGKSAIDTANRIFGIGRWGYRVLSLNRETAGEQVFYTADIELYVFGCPFPFPGQGEGVPQRDTADQYAKARKEAVTDALKRALRHYGDQFGNCLYDDESLIEDSQGNLVPAKNIHPSQQNKNGNKPAPPAARRTVDATPPQHSAKVVEETPLADIPSARKLRQDIADLKMDWRGVLGSVFAVPIKKKEVTLDQILATGDDLSPDYCKHIAQFVQKVKASREKQAPCRAGSSD